LVAYYDRRERDPDPARRLPAFGLEDKEIPFVIELAADGRVLQLRDTRQPDGKGMRGQRFLVPQGEKKTSGVRANLLWDSAEYVIGLERDRKAIPALAFRARIEALPPEARADAGVLAVLAALDRNDWRLIQLHPAWPVIVEANPVMSFALDGDHGELVCQRPKVVSTALADRGAGGAAQAVCLIDGRRQRVARLHASIKGVWGAQTSGANIVSFNARAFESYGKAERQGENAPIGERAAFAYTTALNHLLAKGSPNRAQVGDASTVFWSEAADSTDEWLVGLFGDDPDAGVNAVRAQLEALRSGRLPTSEGEKRFSILGLAPNASRVAVRFWLQAPFAELAPRILQHFDDLAIARQFDSDPRTPSMFRLLTSLALRSDAKHVPPQLAGEWMRSILAGLPYPPALLNAAVIRCRAERDVPYLRASILKACLNRRLRQSGDAIALFKEELDVDQDNNAYRLGRLFAVLERIQEQSARPAKLNATIRDRYFGAASTTPVAVFPTLLRLKNAHLKKLGDAEAGWFEKLIGEICGDLDAPRLTAFAAQLSLPEQGAFALGYYHQRQSFFKRKDGPAPTDTTEPNAEED
jgi:CRISPR-associated protein Csd1